MKSVVWQEQASQGSASELCWVCCIGVSLCQFDIQNKLGELFQSDSTVCCRQFQMLERPFQNNSDQKIADFTKFV